MLRLRCLVAASLFTAALLVSCPAGFADEGISFILSASGITSNIFVADIPKDVPAELRTGVISGTEETAETPEPANPAESANTADPANTEETTNTADSVNITEPVNTADSVNTTEPVNTADSADTAEPAKTEATENTAETALDISVAVVSPVSKKTGFDTVDGRLVYYTEDRELLKNGGTGTFLFDGDGFYTTGDADLDASISGIVAEYTKETMTPEEKLSQLYNFMLLHCNYRMGDLHEKGEEGWQLDAVRTMISKNFRGNCYSYAALYRELARAVGFPAEAYSGTVKGEDGDTTPHGWVEIEIDGELYLFDSEMQSFNGVDMYRMPAGNPSTIRWEYDREPETAEVTVN